MFNAALEQPRHAVVPLRASLHAIAGSVAVEAPSCAVWLGGYGFSKAHPVVFRPVLTRAVWVGVDASKPSGKRE